MGAPIGSLSDHAAVLAESAAHLFAPSLFHAAWPTYAGFWEHLDPASKAAIVARASAAALAAAAPAVLSARSRLTARDGLIRLRGPQRLEGGDASRALRKRFAKQVRRRPDHDLGPGIPFPADMWTRHVLIVGGVGAGKTTFIKPLLRSVSAANEQMLVFDPKGEFTAELGDADILAPWDSRSLVWDIAADMKNTQLMRRFAAAFVADSADPMWANAARQLLCGLLLCLRKTKGIEWGWRDLADLVALPQPDLLAIMRAHHPEAVRVVERASVTTQGVLINLSAFCSPILDLADAWGDAPRERRIGFRRWIKGRSSRRQIVLQGHGAYEDLTQKYVAAIIGLISATVSSVEMTDDPDRKIWIVADELPEMSKVPIRQLFSVGRSRGVRCVVACQDFAQLEQIHGEQTVRALTSMCGTLIVGQMSPGDTSEKICKTIGSREHERMNVSTSMSASGESRGLSFSRETVPLYSPTELASRLGPTKDGKGVTLLVFTGGDAHELFYPFAVSKKVREAHVPARWTLGPSMVDPTCASPQGDAAVARGGDALGGASIEEAASSDVEIPPPSDASYMQELERLAGEAL
ncbi:MAG: type IV secretion system DNA-binding domain-containing protein [Paraburkholderia sp.]|uniref:type IV secretion system DNA-binding domain-containing protein n=1 Tax=Paraburkholderia sp. TaxID=1926495 RepID=UPI003C5889EC